jgi:hypothetical protein
MNKYFISTSQGYIHTNDEKMTNVPFTIDEMIADHSVLDDPGTPENKRHKIYFATKNGKDYWQFGEYA